MNEMMKTNNLFFMDMIQIKILISSKQSINMHFKTINDSVYNYKLKLSTSITDDWNKNWNELDNNYSYQINNP